MAKKHLGMISIAIGGLALAGSFYLGNYFDFKIAKSYDQRQIENYRSRLMDTQRSSLGSIGLILFGAGLMLDEKYSQDNG